MPEPPFFVRRISVWTRGAPSRKLAISRKGFLLPATLVAVGRSVCCNVWQCVAVCCNTRSNSFLEPYHSISLQKKPYVSRNESYIFVPKESTLQSFYSVNLAASADFGRNSDVGHGWGGGRAAWKASWNSAGVEPVHWKPAGINPGSLK